MANYFTSSDDATYLDAATQARSDIAILRTDAEALVIAQYRRAVDDRRFTHQMGYDDITTGLENLSPDAGDTNVYLRWFEEDADDVGSSAEEVRFKVAMKREIAQMIKYLASRRSDGGAETRVIKSETRGRRSVTYADEAITKSGDLPANFGLFLKPYDTRPRTWVG